MLDGSGSDKRETSLTAVAWRENGVVYYAPTSEISISSYRWLLLNKPDLESFYARVHLLLTPTKVWCPWTDGSIEVEVRTEGDYKIKQLDYSLALDWINPMDMP